MAAIVRVKRRIDEDPADSIVFSCKRAKHRKTEEGEQKSLFKFATTVPIKEEAVANHIKKAIKREKLAKEYKRHGSAASSVSTKSRNASRAASNKTRYKIVSEKRGIDLLSLDKEIHQAAVVDVDTAGASGRQAGDSKIFCLYDVIQHDEESAYGRHSAVSKAVDDSPITCNGVAMVREKVAAPKEDPTSFVYDLYYMNNQDFDFRALETILAIEALRDQSVLMDYRHEEEEVCFDDEEDSNDESNWRNEYPEEDPDYYGDNSAVHFDEDDDELERGFHSDEDVRRRFHGMGIDGHGEQDSSSDEEEDRYSRQRNHHLLGPTTSYRKYKARVARELESKDDEDT